MNLHHFAKDVDIPVPIFFWDPPEFVAAVCMVGLGIVMHAALFGFVGAIIVLSASKKLKEGAKRAQAQHLLWRLGIPMDPALNHFPHPTKSEFIE